MGEGGGGFPQIDNEATDIKNNTTVYKQEMESTQPRKKKLLGKRTFAGGNNSNA